MKSTKINHSYFYLYLRMGSPGTQKRLVYGISIREYSSMEKGGERSRSGQRKKLSYVMAQ